MDCVMQKRVFEHMQKANAHIHMRMRTVWPVPSLSANRIIGYYRLYDWKTKARMNFTHAQDDLILRI